MPAIGKVCLPESISHLEIGEKRVLEEIEKKRGAASISSYKQGNFGGFGVVVVREELKHFRGEKVRTVVAFIDEAV